MKKIIFIAIALFTITACANADKEKEECVKDMKFQGHSDEEAEDMCEEGRMEEEMMEEGTRQVILPTK